MLSCTQGQGSISAGALFPDRPTSCSLESGGLRVPNLPHRGTWHEGVAQGQQVAQHVVLQAPRARRLWGRVLEGVALPAPPHRQHVGLQLPVCLPGRPCSASAWQACGLSFLGFTQRPAASRTGALVTETAGEGRGLMPAEACPLVHVRIRAWPMGLAASAILAHKALTIISKAAIRHLGGDSQTPSRFQHSICWVGSGRTRLTEHLMCQPGRDPHCNSHTG